MTHDFLIRIKSVLENKATLNATRSTNQLEVQFKGIEIRYIEGERVIKTNFGFIYRFTNN